MARDIEVRHCRALVAVHDGGGVGAAARALGVAQSSVSETLLSLERLLQMPVTQRRAGQATVLTTAAEALLPHARGMIRASEAALAAGLGRRTTIRLGTVESIGSYVLPAPLARLRREAPEIEVSITIGLCADLKALVARSEIDVALTVEGGEGGPPAVALVAVAATDHPLAGRTVAATDLRHYRMLLTDPKGAFHDLLTAWRLAEGLPPGLGSGGSVDGVKLGLADNESIGVLPDYAVARELAHGSLVALDLLCPLPPVQLRITHAEPRRPLPGLDELLRHVTAAR